MFNGTYSALPPNQFINQIIQHVGEDRKSVLEALSKKSQWVMNSFPTSSGNFLTRTPKEVRAEALRRFLQLKVLSP